MKAARKLAQMIERLKAQGMTQAQVQQTLLKMKANSAVSSVLVETIVRTAFTRSAAVGFQVQSVILRDPLTITTSRISGWAEHSLQAATSVKRALEAKEFMTSQAAELFMDDAMDSVVRKGFETGQFDAATEGSGEFKTWIRFESRMSPRPHAGLEGVTIPISEDFILPAGPNAGQRVYGPRDDAVQNYAAEWIRCGHGLIYSREAMVSDLPTPRERANFTVTPPEGF